MSFSSGPSVAINIKEFCDSLLVLLNAAGQLSQRLKIIGGETLQKPQVFCFQVIKFLQNFAAFIGKLDLFLYKLLIWYYMFDSFVKFIMLVFISSLNHTANVKIIFLNQIFFVKVSKNAVRGNYNSTSYFINISNIGPVL
jgi:hypothetical protein